MAYVYPKAAQLQGTALVGSHQCVALLQYYADLPHTACWRAGALARGNLALAPGTAIATFVDGRYPNQPHGNHAAFYLEQDAGGLWVMDQWAGDPTLKPLVSRRRLRWKGCDGGGAFVDPSNNGDAFSVIERTADA